MKTEISNEDREMLKRLILSGIYKTMLSDGVIGARTLSRLLESLWSKKQCR